ncbi:1-phosphatidylinositol 3-phosphate 5-kinase isoform X2 [Phymastichus coffea]|uniref:1-phosphatidylinositol 3-phosphate 5-kinase isoform X2 n=1 Tax=Phymastichus coffea TaxID=108790 RepID=UPI00273B22DD|nr:1-phosphatidylinositol 3-phosphate 5-kinase isoform X2 [Phymastichus coffea]
MNKNLNSPNKLTEFAPLSPEENPPVVASIFSKIFSFTKGSLTSNTASTTTKDEGSTTESDSWQQSKSAEKSPSQDTASLLSFSVEEGRSLPNVLKRISNIVASKNTSLQSYKNSELRSYWMPDSVSKQCYECGERFTTFRRRHHCRVCGQIFCAKCCCDEIPGKIMGCTGDLRVCTYCCKVVLSYLQSSDMRSDLSADLKALQEDLEEKYGNNTLPPLQKSNANQNTEDEMNVRRKTSVGYMEEKYAFRRSPYNYLTSQERTLALQNSASLRMLYEEVFRSNTAILLQTHRIRLNRYNHCFVATELVDWLLAHNKAATRIQATAIGQALFEAGFVKPVLMDNCFSDSPALFKPAKLSRVHSKDILIENQTPCDAQEPAWVKTIPQYDANTEDSENESKQFPQISQGRIPSSSSSFYLDLNVEASTVTLKRPTSDDMLSVATDSSDGIFEQKEINFQSQDNNSKIPEDLLNDTLLVQDIKEKEGWHQTANLKNTYNESSVYASLTSSYKQHEEYLLRQLLNKEGLSQNWSEIILQIAHQVVDRVRPDLHHDTDDMDIRQYVQIKKSPGGSKNDCEIVSGIVCSKNVAHKGMDAMIANPKILLLRCGLTYQRVEGRLLSLEPVLMQESEYLGHTVARINALGPDIVLVHKSVARLAQDRLRECNVTLVLNVKLSILERLARCTGAHIVDTIDAHMSARYKLGICKKFYLRNFPSEKTGVKTLMYFEGCAHPHLGATVLLRGGSQSKLKKVKNVASMMIFAAYSCRLEKSFLMDEFAKPPSSKDNAFLDESSRNSSPNKTKDLASNQKKPKTSFEETMSVITVDEQNFDRQFSASKSIPNKSDISNKMENNDDVNKNDNFEQVSALLMNATSSYDTLKLFKPKSKSSIDELKNSDKPSLLEADTSGDHNSTLDLFSKATGADDKSRTPSKDRPSIEEKRVHGQSVSDRSDPLHQYLNEDGDEEVFDPASPNGQCLSVADLPLLNKFKKALEGTILSVSPYLKFTIPYLETEPGRNCVLRSFFPKELYYSAYFFDKIKGAKLSDTTNYENSQPNIILKPPHPLLQIKLTLSADSREVQNMLAHFRACGSRLDKIDPALLEKKPISMQSEASEQQQQVMWPDCLDPVSHQRLSVLFCSFLHNTNTDNTPAFCVNPWVVNMDLYGRNDIALGRFLERYCLTTEYKCPAQNCRAQIAQHVRRFVHDGGCVHISLCAMNIDPFSQGQEKSNQIFMWSKCTKCKGVSPVVPISDDTWSLSFAKYLELRFHGSVYTRRGTDTCQHSLHHDHHQFFCKRNMLAVMRYCKISQWEISLPPPLIHISYDSKLYASIVEEMKGLGTKGDEMFSCVREKINGLQLDSETLASLKTQLSKDQQYFKNKIDELQLKFTLPPLENKKTEGKSSEKQVQNLVHRIEDNIVIVKRVIADAVETWNSKINEASSKKKDDRLTRKATERTPITTGTNIGGTQENDGYNTEDNAFESQAEDQSPMSADYNAVEAIAAIQEAKLNVVESSDNEVPESHTLPNPDDIVVLQGSPKTRHRTYSDAMSTVSEEAPDKKKKKKTILSQLLPSTSTMNIIPSPLGYFEHHLLPLGSTVPIVVYESEPSSIIAYALDSIEYKHAVQSQIRDLKPPELAPSPLNKRKLQDNKENVSDVTQSGETKKSSMLSFLRGTSPNPHILGSPMETDKPLLGSTMEATQSSTSTATEKDDELKTKPPQPIFVEVQFADSTTDFFCKIYFAVQFAALRERVLSCGEDGYTRSLSRSVQWAARGGKSGSTFCKTRDDRFILKEMKPIDLQIFLDFAPNYFAYMEKCQQTNQPTLLGKIVGVYRVSFRNTQSSAAIQMNFLVMENLFYNRSITDKFDLKGSVRNRLVNPEEVEEGELVLLDENLLNMSCDSPLYIRPHAKAVLNKAIEEDTKFLADNCVMDYSLLVGLEPNSDELVLGIIDYIRTFTWDKKIETLLKRKILTNSQGKLPTIVSPIEYRARFITAMHKYFLPVPDRWFGLNRGVTAT